VVRSYFRMVPRLIGSCVSYAFVVVNSLCQPLIFACELCERDRPCSVDVDFMFACYILLIYHTTML